MLFDILTNGNGAFIINGPRRCGKTLLLSTIECMYSQPFDWWQKHCSNLWITQKNPGFLKKDPFPILRFDFSGVNTVNEYYVRIGGTLNKSIREHHLPLELIDLINSPENAKSIFNEVMGELKFKFNGNKPIILIDESDQPLLLNMQNADFKNEERVKIMEDMSECYQKFYSNLKSGLGLSDLSFVVICAHSMIVQSTIYSG